jgi:hypothetical protein
MNDKSKNCFQCKHFFITWDKNFPRGCKVYDVKSRDLPCMIVAASTKEGCVAYELKANKVEKKDNGLDLNRDDLW